jgi:hypothetical protein
MVIGVQEDLPACTLAHQHQRIVDGLRPIELGPKGIRARRWNGLSR